MVRINRRAGQATRRAAHPVDEDLVLATAREQAAALLEFLHSSNGKSGTISGTRMVRTWCELHHVHHWALVPWQSVARELRHLLGDKKKCYRNHRDRMGRRRRTIIWHIPASTPEASATDVGASPPEGCEVGGAWVVANDTTLPSNGHGGFPESGAQPVASEMSGADRTDDLPVRSAANRFGQWLTAARRLTR